MHSLKRKSSVILVVIDALRADMIGTQPDGRILMPNLTALAERNIVFDRALATGSWTLAAMPGIMTSNYVSTFGGVWSSLPVDVPTLAELFAAAGYRTAGLTTNYLLDTRLGYERGFQMFQQMADRVYRSWFDNIRGVWRLLPSSTFHKAVGMLGITAYPPQAPDASEVTAAAGSWVKVTDHAVQPAFLWMHFIDTHAHYHARAVPADHRLRAEAWLAKREYNRLLRTQSPPSDDVLNLLRRGYEGAAARVDAALGAFFDDLRQAGLWDDAVVIVTADHGEEFGEHGLIDHHPHHLFDETIRVPLIVKLPEAERGRTISEPISMIDLAPTLLDLSDIAVPDAYRGHSLRPLWEGRDRPGVSDVLITESGKHNQACYAACQGNYKLILGADQPNSPRLFNLAADPAEQHDIAASNPDIVARLTPVLEDHIALGVAYAATSPTATLDDDLRDRLLGLGYLVD